MENQGNYEINNFRVLTAAECQKKLNDERVALQKKQEEEKLKTLKTIQWLTENVHPLKSVVAGAGFEDLQWLKPVLKDVKYVGLGEATHGTREFFQMKHRMLEFLVKQMGFTVFAMEASYQGCENINNYILNGKGDAHSALASQGFWTWDTEEVIDMIEWMRKYNLTAPNNKKVQFFGFDIQTFAKSGAIDSIRNYLNMVDTTLAKQKDKLLQWFYKQDYDKTLYTVITNSMQEDTGYVSTDSFKMELSDLLVSMAMKKGDYVFRSSEKEYAQSFYNINNILQFVDAYNPKNKRMQITKGRDYYMANNFKNFVQQNPDKKIMLWAHNGHIAKNPPFLGSILKNAYGKLYYAICFAFNQGSFQAREISSGKIGELKEFTVTSSKELTLDWHFAQTHKGNFIVDFQQKNLPEIISDFTNTPMKTRGFGSNANSSNFNEVYSSVVIQKALDAMIFIDSTTRARPTPTGIR